jgi:hypothetical protein
MTTLPDNPMDSSPAETFAASRWTQGNFFFPTKLIVSPQRVSRVKGRLLGSNEGAEKSECCTQHQDA